MKEENQPIQNPPIQTAKAAEYFIDLYDQNGFVLDEKQALELASSENLKDEIARQHRVLSIAPPPQQDLDSLFGSFVDEAEVEKKNLLDNTLSALESSSVLEERDSSSELDRKVFQPSIDQDPMGPEKLFSDSLDKIDMSIFSMSGEDAAVALDKQLGLYGFSFSPASNNRRVSITAPNGETQDFRLFTEEYRSLPGQTEGIDMLADRRLSQMKQFIESEGRATGVDNLSAIMAAATPDNILDEIMRLSAKYDDDATSDMNEVLRVFDEKYNINDYVEEGKLNFDKVARGYDAATKRLISKSENFETAASEKLESAVERFNINKRNFASVMSGVLSKSGAYAKIDVNSPEVIAKLGAAGLSPADIPLEAIKINGIPRSLNYLTSNILYDFDKVQAIRDGKITIEIGDPKAAGILAPYVQKAKSAAETQKAFSSQNAGSKFIRFTEEVGELGTNFIQGVGLSLYEIAVNHAYLYYDSLRAIGLSEEDAGDIVYGSTEVPALYGSFRPEQLEKTRNEYLPQWDGDYLDSNGFHEIITRGSQDLAGSLVHTGLYMVPGGLPFALTNTAVSAYSGDRMNFENLRRDVEEKRKRGYVLTEEEMNIINMSDAKARSLSITKAATETALTSLFTAKFFKNYRNFAGVKPKIESLHGNISSFNKVYAKAVRNDIIGLASRYSGVSFRAIGTEIPEEELIAFTNYTSDIVFGTKKFDSQEAKRLFLNTGISSMFTSAAMGKVAALGTNRRARKMAVDIVASNLTLPQERLIMAQKAVNDAEIKKRQDQLTLEGIDPSTDVYSTILKSTSLDIADKINRIQEEKVKLAEKMPSAEKVEFLEIMEAIEKTKGGMKDATTVGQQRAILDEIAKLKQKGKKMLSKYPSELSYYFADEQVQSSFESQAVQELSTEYEARGEEFTFRSGDEAVQERAASLYNDYLKNNSREKEDSYYAFESVGAVDIPSIKTETTEEEEFSDTKELMSMLNGMNQAETYLTDLIQQDDQFIKMMESKSKLMNDVDRIQIGELKKKIEDPNSTPEEVEQAKIEYQEIANNYDFLEDSFRLEFAEIQGRVFADKFNRSLQETGVVGDDKIRMDNIYSRMKAVDVVGMGSNLSKAERETIKRFKKNLENGKRPQFGRMEAMLDAMEAVDKIYSRSGGKIDLSKVIGDDATLTEKALAAVSKMVTGIYSKGIGKSGGFATKDVLARTLFRDREVGAPFIDAMNEAFRSSAEADQKASKVYKDHKLAYSEDSKEDPRSITNDYEMYILASLRRRSKELLPDGRNGEFARTQGLILVELEKRRKDFEKNPENKTAKLKYDTWKEIVDRLGVKDAMNYEEASANATQANKSAIDRMASIMPGKRAFDRINDFESYNAFEYEEGSYIPLFMSKNGEGFNDFFSVSDAGSEAIAGSLKNVTRPNTLEDGVRLMPEGFYDNFYNAFRGMELDISSKKNYEMFDYMVNSPRFEALFEGKSKRGLIDAFKNVKPAFQRDVRSSSARVLDPEKLPKNYLQKLSNAIYGAASAVALARWSQRPSQFYSGVAGGSGYLKGSRAKTYLAKRTLAYTFGLAKTYDGNTKKFVLSDQAGEFLRVKDAKLGNIYMKSRTGLRNSVLANLAVDANKKIPISYYVSAFKIDPAKESTLTRMLGSSATIDRFLDFVIKSNEFNLDLWLGSSDRLAANALFEAAYIDNKESRGFKIGNDLNAWWAAEDQNADLEAIRYADEIVAKTMRQTGMTSEADVYSPNASLTTKNLMRTFFPFSKFIMNAKSDIANNILIALDPNIPQSQKQLAERAIIGRGSEILMFNFMKLAAGRMMVNGVISAFGFGLGGEEEDIEKYGGMTRLIGEDLLPIVSKEDFDPMKLGVSEATSYEQFYTILQAQAGFTEINGIAEEFKTYSRTFEDKFTTQGDYSVIGPTIQDLLTSMTPIPVPDVADDVLALAFNQLYGEDIAQEYISRDLEKTGTAQGKLAFLGEKSGLASIAFGQATALQRAIRLAKDFEIEKFQEAGPNVIEHLSAPTDPMREKLIGATQLLVTLRINSLLNPVTPRADLDKLADKLERAIESNFSGSSKDEKLHEIKENYLFPFEGYMEEEDTNNTSPE